VRFSLGRSALNQAVLPASTVTMVPVMLRDLSLIEVIDVAIEA
jgi:hypothetical protein